MNIKQSVSLLFILMSVSFSSNAENVYRVYMVSWGDAPLKEGQIITDSYISSIRFPNFSNCRAIFNRIECDHFPYSRRTEIGRMFRLTCPDGQELDPITGKCESKPYCEEQSTIDAMSQYHDSCTAKGGTPKIFCDNNTQSFDADCELPDQPCDPDSDDWPACLDDDPEPDQCDSTSPDWVDSVGKCCNESNNYCDEKPPEPCTIFNSDAPHCQNDDDDIEPPTPDDDLEDPEFPDFPDTGGSGDSDGSGNSDIPEPPVDDESDANKAIKALNKDMNKQLTQINNDLNSNHKTSLEALGSLKSSLDLNTKSVVDGANHTASAVNSQTSVLTELGNKTNGLLKSINGLLKGGFDGLNESLEGLKDAFKVDPVAVNPKHLYESGDLSRLRSEVESLKSDYEAELRSMKSYFNFTSGVSSGDFNSHDLALNWHGHAVTATNQVFVSMRDNAGVIAAVVLFGFGMVGIKEIMRA
ncbi:hypothetical protein HB761_00100 [Vibrio campbellii]|uniref:Chitin-binding type-2 domain-containing protein n=1 Tax=Vibrio campbellii TaxID=680 RepID=A0AAE9MYE4_9VIBR|nr:hypothetical protein [Vibrio campbellii]UTZ25277.1 hypothetical protein HB761_00100 [Vibrio campbellii]